MDRRTSEAAWRRRARVRMSCSEAGTLVVVQSRSLALRRTRCSSRSPASRRTQARKASETSSVWMRRSRSAANSAWCRSISVQKAPCGPTLSSVSRTSADSSSALVRTDGFSGTRYSAKLSRLKPCFMRMYSRICSSGVRASAGSSPCSSTPLMGTSSCCRFSFRSDVVEPLTSAPGGIAIPLAAGLAAGSSATSAQLCAPLDSACWSPSSSETFSLTSGCSISTPISSSSGVCDFVSSGADAIETVPPLPEPAVPSSSSSDSVSSEFDDCDAVPPPFCAGMGGGGSMGGGV